MTIAQRVLLSDFSLANPVYANARVWVYEADLTDGGAATTTLATLYRSPTGTREESNPLRLDGDGKLVFAVYVDVPVVARITEATVPVHDTGVLGMIQRFRDEWESGAVYQIGDVIRDGEAGSDTGYLYMCAEPHTSDDLFADDLAADRWVLYVTGGSGGGGGSGVDVVGTTSVSAGTSSANYLKMTGAASGSYPTLSALGSDTDIDVLIAGKGTGRLNSTKEYIGSAAARPSVNANTLVYHRTTTNYSSTGWSAWNVSGNFTGTLTGNLNGIHNIGADGDAVEAGAYGLDLLRIYNSQIGGSGARVTLSAGYALTGDATISATTQFHVGAALTARAYASMGGIPGSSRGSLFAANTIAALRDGSGAHWQNLISHEADVLVSEESTVDYLIGVSSILHQEDSEAHTNRGIIQDSAFVAGTADYSYVPVGWRIILGLGGATGWSGDEDTRVIASEELNAAFTSRPRALADVIDVADVSLKRSLIRMSGASIDLSGNVGGQVTSGGVLQTTSIVQAKTAGVATIVPLQPDGGGLYAASGVPSLAISAPYGGGTNAAATIATHGGAAINTMTAGGSGYAVGQTLTQTGGTFSSAAQVKVTRVDGTGKIRGLRVVTRGSYTALPSGEQTFTGGTGSGMTASLLYTALTVTVSTAGTTYAQYPAPEVTFSGGTVFRRPVFKVTMTATDADLSLNPAGTTVVKFLKRSSDGTVAAAGTTQGTATALTSEQAIVNTAVSNTGAKLLAAVVGKQHVIQSDASNVYDLSLYPQTGERIREGTSLKSANAPLTFLRGTVTLNCFETGIWSVTAFY